MRAFVVMCFVALATADKLGYNYQPVGHSDSGLSFTPGSSGLGGGSTGGLGGLGGLSGGPSAGLGGLSGGLGGSLGGLGGGLSGGLSGTGGPSGLKGYGGLGDGASGGLSSLGGSIGGLAGLNGGLGGLSGGLAGNLGGLGGSSSGSLESNSDGNDSSDSSSSSGPNSSSSSSSAGAPGAVEYEKEFYTYTADDNDFDEPEANDQANRSVKKNIRVIFIKGPENNALENAAINLARQASEQKTAIYVLQKQTSVSDLANKLQDSHDAQSHQPEVHFVKYRTPEDAANAQKAIQAQYDQLDGPSQAHDGGVAPVHNFASPAAHGGPSGLDGGVSGPAGGVSGGNGQFGGISGGPGKSIPSATYLPAAILRKLRF
ncbi:pupal cuticle protein 36a [Bactrocera dorsalis]|uniref:Pupal cuticle protein 36a n=1 Tax=Bactrocera dorsalis TaxID=27457 RepID=A0A6I9UM87_BACDO|nr:pupal cuticle protein 36a [Bactrocera dorsalis]